MLEAWMPIGYLLPDGARCGRALAGEVLWQIIDTGGGGRALLVHENLARRWTVAGLIEAGDLTWFTFDGTPLAEISSGPSQILTQLAECRSPNSKAEALAFAAALRDTRKIDGATALQDAIYVEKLSRLLPTYGISSRTDDDIILGYWLTGGAPISAKSFRRLRQALSWLDSSQLRGVLETAGFEVSEIESPSAIGGAATAPEPAASPKTPGADVEPVGDASASARTTFSLPGRPALEEFFNDHVIDILLHQDRYRALGVGFPRPVVLHGPPGCGKTFAIDRLIEYLGWPSYAIEASTVASPYIHDTSRKVAEMFAQAIQNAPSVLVIDEMEAFLADRELGAGASSHRVEEVAEFLRRIPEAVEARVLVVGMTNRIEMIDPAVLRRGRFDHVVEVGYADTVEVVALLNKLIEALPCDKTVDVESVARRLGGRPLSDVSFVVREAARLSARAGAAMLSQDSLLAALDAAPSRGTEDPRPRIGFV